MLCRTACRQWAVQSLQCTVSLPWLSGQCNSCNTVPHYLGGVAIDALPHRLGAVGRGTQAMRGPNEPLSEDNLVAPYTLGRYFANNMRVPMQYCNDMLMCCTPFIPEVPDNHSGRLHAAVPVADNAWRDDGGLAMLNELVALMEEAGVAPAYTQHLSPQGHAGGDPND